MKKIIISIVISSFLLLAYFYHNTQVLSSIDDNSSIHKPIVLNNFVTVPDESCKVDNNNNGISDVMDMVNESEDALINKVTYKDAYYNNGGYPPEDEGVCTDVIWRALKAAGIDFKSLIDKDIKSFPKDYPRVNGSPDPNIDFRRVQNQKIFFDKYCSIETSDVIPFNIENLKQWQPGDILLFLKPYEHVGLISNERDHDGVTYVIHNSHPHMKKSKLSWFDLSNIYHYRWRF